MVLATSIAHDYSRGCGGAGVEDTVTLVATYRLVFTQASGDQTSNLADFPNDATAIPDAQHVLSRDVVSIAIGRGEIGGDVEWLGAWDWNAGQPDWSPNE